MINNFYIKTLYLGLTDYCNLNCVMCPQSTTEISNKSKGFMSLDVVDKIIHGLSDVSDGELHLFLMWLGESTMHPQFNDIIKVINNSNDISKIVIYTNGTNENAIFNLIDKSTIPIQIIFSFDAQNPQTYYAIKGRNFLKKIQTSVKKIVESSFLKGNVEISIQFLIMEQNFNEIISFKDYWSNFFNQKSLKFGIISDYNCEDYSKNNINLTFRRTTMNDMAKSDKLYLNGLKKIGILPHKRYVEKNCSDKYNFCTAPFRNLTIDWNGNATFCCYDTYTEINLGNLLNKSLSQIWFGEKASQLRKLFYLKKEIPEICKKCDGFDAPSFTEKEKEKLNINYG